MPIIFYDTVAGGRVIRYQIFPFWQNCGKVHQNHINAFFFRVLFSQAGDETHN